MVSVINIANFSILHLLFSSIAIFCMVICFLDLLLGLGSPVSTFFFDNSAIFDSYLLSSLTFYCNSLIYDLLVMIICLIYDNQIQKCFIILELYLMRMPCKIF